MSAAFKPLQRGDRVRFLRRGAWQPAAVVAVHLDPNRRPGAGRVSYDVQVHPAYYPLRVQAARVDALEGPVQP